METQIAMLRQLVKPEPEAQLHLPKSVLTNVLIVDLEDREFVVN